MFGRTEAADSNGRDDYGLVIVRLEKAAILRVIHQEPAFLRALHRPSFGPEHPRQADLVDQLFNSSEKRLARLLLLLANFGKDGQVP